MAKQSNWEAVLIGIFCVVMGLVATALSGSIFNFFFVPIVIAVLWDYSNKLNDVRKELSEMKSRLSKESPTPSGSS